MYEDQVRYDIHVFSNHEGGNEMKSVIICLAIVRVGMK